MVVQLAQFQQVFFEESFEGLAEMEAGLLNLDPGRVNRELVNGIFRAAHSIKGGAGTFGYGPIAEFTHGLETLLDQIRDGRRSVTQATVNLLLKSVDVLRMMLTAARDGEPGEPERIAAMGEALRAALEQCAAPAPPTPPAIPEAVPDPEQRDPANQRVPVAWHIVFRPHAQLFRAGHDPLRLIRELARLGPLEVRGDASEIPELANFDPESSYLSWDMRLRAPVEQSQVQEIFDWVEDLCDLAIIPLLGAKSRSAPALGASWPATPGPPPRSGALAYDPMPAVSGGFATHSIRVDTGKIDNLINQVGELVITQSMLGLLGRDFDLSRLERLRAGLAQLERHTRALQESVMQIRMLPIGFAFNRFPRLVHDLSARLGKRVELRLRGEATEVDKTVIEKIGDPMVHLVRNSLDHGIETPEERRAAGKPETGLIELNAYHRSGSVVVEIRDDGRGLDRAKLIAKAVERGLIGAGANLTDQQALELVYLPGFTTAERLSDLSGRGVGMDVVRRNVNDLGGGIEIESQPGEGTAFVLRLPLTLAILDGQTIRVGDETYILPLASIVESIQVRPEMLNLVAGRDETCKLRGDFLPVIRLHQLFQVENPRATRVEDGLLVVVEGEGKRCGLLVDDLVGQQQVVVKSLEANFRKVAGISGATILGDGAVALILDIPGLLRLVHRRRARAARQSTGTPSGALAFSLGDGHG